MNMMMNRPMGLARRLGSLQGILFAVLLVAAPRLAAGDEPPAGDKADEPAATGLELVVDPAAEPIPAFEYHLLPPAEKLRRGNAVPIYLRLMYERNDEVRRLLKEESRRFLDMPREELPLDEVGKFLDSFSDVTEQMTAASYRADSNWEYVTEDRDPLSIRLPDAQQMRNFARLLALKARYEIQSGDLESAAREHRRMLPIFKALFWVTNPIPIKYAVNRAGLNAGMPRLPMVEPDEDFTSKFDPVMDQYHIDLPVN